MAEDGASDRKERRRKRRWGQVDESSSISSSKTTTSAPAATTSSSSSQRVLALQESIRARLAAAKAKQQATDVRRPEKRAKQYELDLTVTAPTYQKQKPETTSAKQQQPTTKPSNPYLAHLEQSKDADTTETATSEKEGDVATTVRTSKPRPRHKSLQFREPGHWQEIAQRKREKAALAAAAGFVSGRKTGHTIHAAGMMQHYGPSSAPGEEEGVVVVKPRADAHPQTRMPLVLEWWDVELLPSKLKKEVAAMESLALSQQSKAALQQLGDDGDAAGTDSDATKPPPGDSTATNDTKITAATKPNNLQQLQDLRNRCRDQAALSYSKTAALVQHPVPVRPPNMAGIKPKQPILHLTKEERKRQRKLRRQEKQRQLQDLQAAGLVAPPEPRLTLSNFIQVLGDQAFADPSQIEQRVQEQIQARQRAHWERNQANKLTAEQRRAKRARKLQTDTTSSTETVVAVFYVKDMSHPYHRAKVDLNAQQNNISGGVVETPSVSCVICEGGPKAIQRYKRLMLVRMKWTGPNDDDDNEDYDDHEEDGDDDDYQTQKFNPDNKCELVWQGMVVKPLFQGFVFQSCETSEQARKVLKAKGVEHYWDQVLRHASSQGLQLKLTSANDDEDNPYQNDDREDIVMKE